MSNKNKFQFIYQDISNKIKSGDYSQHQFLPSENQLTEIYHVSRETIRKALNLLQTQGYITKVRGKGSKIIVQDTINFELSKLASFHELNQTLQLNYQTVVVTIEYESLYHHPSIQQALQLQPTDKVLKVVRQRLINQKINIVDIDYFNPSIITGLTKDIAQQSIYHYIENTLNLTISYANKTITFESENEQIIDLFKVLSPAYTATVTAIVFLQDGRPFQYNVSKHRPEIFKFIDFSRREV